MVVLTWFDNKLLLRHNEVALCLPVMLVVGKRFQSTFVHVLNSSLTKRCVALSKQLNLPVINHEETIPMMDAAYLLQHTGERLQAALYKKSGNKMKEQSRWYSNFEDGQLLHRQKQQEHSRTPLVKALGLYSNAKDLKEDTDQDNLFIIDATAGMGEDSFLIASCPGISQLLLIERDPIIHALLRDGYRRGKLSSVASVQNAINRMEIHPAPADSQTVFDNILQKHSPKPDIVYLDPMHQSEDKHKSALPKLKMQLARVIVGSGGEEDDDKLLEAALKVAKRRVVFKRPITAKEDPAVTSSFTAGRAIRYDVYKISPASNNDECISR